MADALVSMARTPAVSAEELTESDLDELADAVMAQLILYTRGTDLWWMWSDFVLIKYAVRVDAQPYRDHEGSDVFQLTELGREVAVRWRMLRTARK